MTSKHQFVGQKVKLSDICSIVSGATPKTTVKDYWGGDIKWITPSELNDDSHVIYNTAKHLTEAGFASARLRMFPEGTVLLTTRAPIGKVAIAGEPMCCNQGFKNLVCSDAVNNEYLYRYLKNRSSELQVLGRGATFKELSKKEVAAYEINLPPLKRQLEAVEKLALVDKQVVIAKTQLDKLDSLVKSRFVEMFGDPSICVNRWRRLRLDKFAQVITGNTPSRKCPEFYGKGIEWVKTDNIADSIVTTAAEQLTDEGRKKARIAPAGSILMACIAGSVKSIGKVGLLDREVAFNQQINAIVPGDKVDARFLLTMLSLSKTYLCSDVNQQLKGILNKSALSAKQFSLPPLILQHQFADFAASVDKSRFVAQQQIEKLQLLYDSLAQEYFGE